MSRGGDSLPRGTIKAVGKKDAGKAKLVNLIYGKYIKDSHKGMVWTPWGWFRAKKDKSPSSKVASRERNE